MIIMSTLASRSTIEKRATTHQKTRVVLLTRRINETKVEKDSGDFVLIIF
jgi:hypothetical protein